MQLESLLSFDQNFGQTMQKWLYIFYSEGSLICRATSPKDHWSEWPLIRRAIALNYSVVSALLCATTQQSYTPGMGVHRMSSVVLCTPVFSKTIKSITAICFERYLATISPKHFFFEFLFIISFYDPFVLFCFVLFSLFSVTWDHMGEKVSNDIAPEGTPQSHSQRSCILIGRVSTNFFPFSLK